jgi:hypothetical protein
LNLNFGKSFHFQDNINVHMEKIDEPIKQANRVAHSGCVNTSSISNENDKSGEDLRSITATIMSKAAPNSSYSLYHDSIDHHHWTHSSGGGGGGSSSRNDMEAGVVCSFLLTHELYFNGSKTHLEEKDIKSIHCTRRMLMSFSSLSSSLSFDLQLSPKTEVAAKEVKHKLHIIVIVIIIIIIIIIVIVVVQK